MITATEALGCYDWEDTLPVPAVPNAETAEEIFSEDFSEEALDEAWRIMQSHVLEAAQQLYAHLLYIDSNDLICEYHGHDLTQFLESQGFEFKKSVLGDKLRLFLHKESHGIIIVHRPLGIAGDSRKFIALEAAIQRSLEAGVLQQISFRAQKLPCLPQERPKHDFVVAGACYEITNKGYHLNRRNSAAMFRNALTDQNAIALCKVAGSNLSEETAITLNVRKKERGYFKTTSDRFNDFAIINYARNMISKLKSKSPAALNRLGEDLHELFQQNANASTQSARWNYLFRAFEKIPGSLECQEVLRMLEKQRKKNRANQGNAQATGLQQNMKDLYEEDWQRVLQNVISYDNPERAFWCMEQAASTEDEKYDRYNGLPDEVDGLPVVRLLVYQSVRERLGKMNRTRVLQNNTKAQRVKPFPAGVKYGLSKAPRNERTHKQYPLLVKAMLHYKGEEEAEDIAFMDTFFDDTTDGHQKMAAVEGRGERPKPPTRHGQQKTAKKSNRKKKPTPRAAAPASNKDDDDSHGKEDDEIVYDSDIEEESDDEEEELSSEESDEESDVEDAKDDLEQCWKHNHDEDFRVAPTAGHDNVSQQRRQQPRRGGADRPVNYAVDSSSEEEEDSDSDSDTDTTTVAKPARQGADQQEVLVDDSANGEEANNNDSHNSLPDEAGAGAGANQEVIVIDSSDDEEAGAGTGANQEVIVIDSSDDEEAG